MTIWGFILILFYSVLSIVKNFWYNLLLVEIYNMDQYMAKSGDVFGVLLSYLIATLSYRDVCSEKKIFQNFYINRLVFKSF